MIEPRGRHRSDLLLLLFVLVTACGGTTGPGGSDDGSAVLQVTITPGSVSLYPNEEQEFSVRVGCSGSCDKGVRWSAKAGSVTSTGGYRAPDAPLSENDLVIAESKVNPSVADTAEVSVSGPFFNIVGEMAKAREFHTSVVCETHPSKVILIGGGGPGATPRTVESYNVDSHQSTLWDDTFQKERLLASASCIPGTDKILVTGGLDALNHNGAVLLEGEADVHRTAALLDIDQQTITEVSSDRMVVNRAAHRSIPLCDGRIAITGGKSDGEVENYSRKIGYIEVYNPETGQFTHSDDWAIFRAWHRLAIYNCDVYAFGRIEFEDSTDVERFNPEDRSVDDVGFTLDRGKFGFVVDDEHVYLVAGQTDTEEYRGEVERWDFGSLSSTVIGQLPKPRFAMETGLACNALVSAGGAVSEGGARPEVVATSVIMDLDTEEVSSGPPFEAERAFYTLHRVGGYLLAFGGTNGNSNALPSVEKYRCSAG